METPPPRLFVIMARTARLAVVLRRGPSEWCHLIQWDTHRDVFTPGAWFHGRIYEDKCDLSPDGKLFVYAAFKGGKLGTGYTQSWTAISRPPWLHALALWPFGTTYGGGGRFVDDRRVILRGASELHPDHPPGGLPSKKLAIVGGDAPYHASTCEVDGSDWSGRDHDNHLVHATAGQLLRRTGNADKMLIDLRDMSPAPAEPPDWATRPL
jgi:hypothetical protein